jgi:IS5 family transposase
MRNKRITQSSIFETGYVDHEIGRELAAISAWLDTQPTWLDLVARELSPRGRSTFGREGLSAETVLRCAVLKQYRQVGYRELVFLLKDSRSFQNFVRLDPLKIPGKSALQSLISRISADTWELMNQALIKQAQASGVERGQRIRFDATVTETHILSPTDSRLLLDGVRVMVRLLKQAEEQLGAKSILFSNHLRVAKRRHRAIHSARGPQRRAVLYQDLLDVVTKTLGYLEQAQAKVVVCPDIIWPLAWIAEADHYRSLIGQVIDQTQRRVFLGETVPAGEKVVSLFEPHTDIIIKGRREVEYGHKVTLSTGTSGLVLDAVIEAGNPTDTQCFLPMLERHIKQYGKAPKDLATDGGYASLANLNKAKGLGVQNVAFHKKRGLSIEAMTGQRWLYYKLKRFRAGIEAGISYLKRCFGLSRCNWKGLAHYKAYVWSSIFAHNLVVFGRLRPEPT